MSLYSPKHHHALDDLVSKAIVRHNNNEPVEEILRDRKTAATSYLLAALRSNAGSTKHL